MFTLEMKGSILFTVKKNENVQHIFKILGSLFQEHEGDKNCIILCLYSICGQRYIQETSTFLKPYCIYYDTLFNRRFFKIFLSRALFKT